MGIAHHFTTATTSVFYVSLFKSARAYLHVLERHDEDEKCTSKAEPFFDAVACGDEEGAALIAQMARRSVNPRFEYEEDFYYIDFVMSLYYRDHKPEALGALLAAWQTLGGEDDSRFHICKALFETDQDIFDENLHQLLEKMDLMVQEQMESESIDPDHGSTTAKLSVEALALLRLAKRSGLRVGAEYLFVPGGLLASIPSSFPVAEAWMTPLTEEQLWQVEG